MIKKPKLHVIYVPGLGDSNPRTQVKVISTWKIWGVKAELFQMNWADDISWETKYNKLLTRIDEISESGYKIGLVGASAGAGAVINVFAARQEKILGVVCICGKINYPEEVSKKFFDKNPSFKGSAFEAPNSLEQIPYIKRKAILSKYAIFDETVRQKDSIIDGAINKKAFSVGHFITIATQLLFGAPFFIRFLKNQM